MEGPELLERVERLVLLHAIDRHWQVHLTEMDDLRHSVGLRSYAQKNPLYEYKAEAFTQFESLMRAVRRDVAYALFRSASSVEKFQSLRRKFQGIRTQFAGGEEPAMAKKVRELPKIAAPAGPPPVGRNESCPCGSGKKFKKCCGNGGP
jgi:preprotein translocase subunit SecA